MPLPALRPSTFRKLYFALLDYEAGPVGKTTRPTILAKGSKWVAYHQPSAAKKPKKRKYGYFPFQA